MTYAWRYQELYMKNGPNQGKMKIIWISATHKFLLTLTKPFEIHFKYRDSL